jgi:alkylation response protein AidB-like acyl-CoA dehydrogenase
MFGTEEQKKKYLPRFSKGAISAFALTEPDVGSDPANMATTATPVENGTHYLINGKKLWCTNGPVADVLVVMARTPDLVVRGKPRKRITAFIVEKGMPGFEVEHRCDFMGLKGIQNGLLRFKNVRVPKENIILGEGKGLKLALATLNTGRLTLPAGSLGGSKRCLQIARKWSRQRVQWGKPVGEHEAVASKLGWMSAHLFAMESITWLASAWADKGGQDIRIEAAMAKLFCTEGAWKIVDETVQIRGGRGYETGPSLAGRGEPNWPVERMFRDARINLIIEGTSEIMRLFLAREAVDPHLQKALAVLNPRNPLPQRLKAAVKAGLSYAVWYPLLWLPRLPLGGPAGLPSKLRRHWRYVGRTSRRLARTLFHQMLLNQEKLQERQMLLFRLVDVGVELFAMSAAVSNAARLAADAKTTNAVELADLFCEQARTRIRMSFENLHLPEDAESWRISQDLLSDKYLWMEEGIIGD